MARGIVTHIRRSHPEYQLRMSHWGMVTEAEGARSQEVGPLQGLGRCNCVTHTDTPYTPHPTKLHARASCMLSQEAAKKGKDAMLNEHERHQIELNSMRQSSRKQHQKLKELLPALLAPWPQHCCNPLKPLSHLWQLKGCHRATRQKVDPWRFGGVTAKDPPG